MSERRAWQLVPIEPTHLMLDTGDGQMPQFKAFRDEPIPTGYDVCRDVWAAMLGAAPSHTAVLAPHESTEAMKGAVLEEVAQHFDERANALSGDIFATTTTRAEICRTVAKELRALKPLSPATPSRESSDELASLGAKYLGMSLEDFGAEGYGTIFEDIKRLAGSVVSQARGDK